MRLVGRKRAIVLIDGEHQPAAVGDALEEIAADVEITTVVFCGGGEKVAPAALLDPEQHYGFPLTRAADALTALRAALDGAGAGSDIVIDIADEPILPLSEKLRMASLAMAAGLGYEAPGMSLKPLLLSAVDFEGPKVAVTGTGKRTGKTAVCGHLAALIKRRGGSPAIVSMGRGGPATPQLADPHTGLGELLALSRRGVHAASDYLEDAVLAGVPAVGCRRVGGGPAGETAFTNFQEGVALAAGIEGVDGLLFEGSGASIPPVRADRTICVTGSLEQADTHTGPLRLIEAQMVLVHVGQPETLAAARYWSEGEVVAFDLVPTPAEPLPHDAVVAFFSTGAHEPPGVEPSVASSNLARRAELELDLAAAAAAGCTHYLTELKAAAIDMVADHAVRRGAEVVFVRNRPVAEGVNLDEVLLEFYDDAARPFAAAGRSNDRR